MTEYYREHYDGTCDGCGKPVKTARDFPMGKNSPAKVWVRCSESDDITRVSKIHE